MNDDEWLGVVLTGITFVAFVGVLYWAIMLEENDAEPRARKDGDRDADHDPVLPDDRT